MPNVCLRTSSGRGADEAGGGVVLEPEGEQNVGVAIGASDVVMEGIEISGFATGIGLEHRQQGETLEGITLESMTIREPNGEFREAIASFGDNREVPGEPAADGIDTKAIDVVVYGVSVRDVERNAIKLWGGGDVIDSVVNGSGADAALVGEDETVVAADLPELEARGWATGVAIADPQLVDAKTGDITAREGSPARDAGESIPGLERDILGNPRSAGAGPDIGPVES